MTGCLWLRWASRDKLRLRNFCEPRARGARKAASLVENKPSISLAAFAGKCVLITGAGGFIGSALCGALAAASPRFLVLLDASEHNLHELAIALNEQTRVSHAAVLGDVCDIALLREILERYRPEVIFHAAACKHVPLMEQNPLAAMGTNAIGTWRLLRAVVQRSTAAVRTAPVTQLMLLSTDKAVKPASVMGATKRVAELTLERMSSEGIALQTVRLGNVLGSHGSVAPLFADQIARGVPVTVTHPEAERYFFSLDEGVELIFGAAALETGTFIPKLPTPLKIVELAEGMIREAGDARSREVRVQFTELRPGDKLREEFLNDGELGEVTGDPRLLRVRGPQMDAEQFDTLMSLLDDAVANRRLARAMEILQQLVPDYHPSQTLRELLHQASVAKT
jgi:FlaA1/EpsC-like NDP-sugar epimerase